MDNQKAKAVPAPGKTPQAVPVPSKIPQAAPPVKAPIVKAPTVIPKEKKQGGGNTFIAVIISLVITMLLIVAGLYLGQKYMIEPNNNEMKEQYSVLETKVSDLSVNINNEKDSIQELLSSIDDLKMEVEELKGMEEDTKKIKMGSAWQNYKNNDWGIEFSYPSDWEVYEKDLDGSTYLVVTSKDTQDLLDNKEIFPGYPYNIEIHHYNNFAEFALAKNAEGKNFSEFASMNKSGAVEFIEESGVMENSFTYLENGYSSIYCLVTEHNGDIYDFRMGRGGDSLGKDEMMILNLLKFTK